MPIEQPPSYLDSFEEKDTLGYEYNFLLRNKLVYLKYNSSAVMKLRQNGRTIKHLGGMFIPLDKLLADPLKKVKNIFKTLPLDYTENKHSVDTSFGGNCFSKAPALRFSSNYESSNLLAVVKVCLG